MAYNETPISEGLAMFVAIIAATLGVIIGTVATRLFDMWRFKKTLAMIGDMNGSKTWHAGFEDGWYAASHDYTNVKASYENLRKSKTI